jgi:hypothetical protein
VGVVLGAGDDELAFERTDSLLDEQAHGYS